MLALSVPGIVLAVVAGLLAVGAIAWLLSPRGIALDVDPLGEERPVRPR